MVSARGVCVPNINLIVKQNDVHAREKKRVQHLLFAYIQRKLLSASVSWPLVPQEHSPIRGI